MFCLNTALRCKSTAFVATAGAAFSQLPRRQSNLVNLGHRHLCGGRAFATKPRETTKGEGPLTSGTRWNPSGWPEDDFITYSRFCHGWSIAQFAKGNRYCADDVLCAYLAVNASSTARRLLDLGSGVGTIGLLWLGQQPQPFSATACTLLEAQEASVSLCRWTIEQCRLEKAVDLRHGDLRDTGVLSSLGGGFDVITANPPYMPANTGALPKHPQRALCRYELQGGLQDFCKAAASQLSATGVFCLVHTAPRAAEVLEALAISGFTVNRAVNIIFRGARKSVAYVSSFTPSENKVSSPEDIEVQKVDGTWSPGYLEICRTLGL